jgi:phosphoglucosamine mutase
MNKLPSNTLPQERAQTSSHMVRTISSEDHARAPRPRLFGTDGVRGVANAEPITPQTALKLGRALAYVFKTASNRRHRVLIGKDTRLSGYMLETALASGICSMGVDVMLVGPLPTPAIAFLTRSMRADAGVVISASHNPFCDNGIKFFSGQGFKLDDEIERRIEGLVFDERELDHARPAADGIGKAFRIDDALGRYQVFLKACLPRTLTFDGLKVVVDCANGAAYRAGPEVFEELGAEVIAIGVQPNGRNINAECGALYPQVLQETVIRTGADVGLALDGDGDRAILVDSTGALFDGDDVLAMMGRKLKREGRLAGNRVVATVMSNLGLERSLAEVGVGLVRTDVGDPAVVREMLANSYNLGGEQSGHIIFMDYSTTGDGLMTAIMVVAHMIETGKPLSQLRAMRKAPQVMRSVPVRCKVNFDQIPELARKLAAVKAKLGNSGRLLVRYSGTEMAARVMAEGEDLDEIKLIVDELSAEIAHHIGADMPA